MTQDTAPGSERRAYQEAIDFLFGRIDYERTPHRARSVYDFKLSRMEQLLQLLGNPHRHLPVVHIAGTKGKGSTATLVSRILEQAGYRTGLFTSPHMVRFEERMTVNGREPDSTEMINLVGQLRAAVSQMDKETQSRGPTFFELSTALGWFYFLSQKADLAVLEVGLGGRLDSTNLCSPLVTAITSISRDHTRLLGETLPEIAREKAGIIKPGVPIVVGQVTPEVLGAISEIATRNQAPRIAFGQEYQAQWHPRDLPPYSRPVRFAVSLSSPEGTFQDIDLTMPGEHQAVNASVALAIVQQLRKQGYAIDDAAVREGCLRAQCPLRTEVVGQQPLFIVDAAHNEASIAAVCSTLRQITTGRRFVLFGASRDKEIEPMLRQLRDVADELVLTRYLNNPRAVPVEELAQLASQWKFPDVTATESPAQAMEYALQQALPNDLICTTGSFFLAAEVRELFRAQTQN